MEVEEILNEHDSERFMHLTALMFSGSNGLEKPWALCPFEKHEETSFELTGQWKDPTNRNWKSTSIFNGSLIEHDGKLFLAYRASPVKESLDSRIGIAWMNSDYSWEDYSGNPIIYPSNELEGFGCEDPKLYKKDGLFYLFYNRAYNPKLLNNPTLTVGDVGCDICLATSHDLLNWERQGAVVSHTISGGWAKAAVIPRNLKGEPVAINGEYWMFVSEVHGGQQLMGKSKDLINWTFEPKTFLELDPEIGELQEVACCVADDRSENFILDFFYFDKAGAWKGGQGLFKKSDPTQMLEFSPGGTLSWGGITRFRDDILYAQGWDAPEREKHMYLYRSLTKKKP
jgi:predicted GH43/DUF377 family glycosyl hydrolase